LCLNVIPLALLTIGYLTFLVLVWDIPAMAKVHDEMAATTIGTMDADPEAGEHGGEHGGGLGISQESLKMTR